MWSAGTCWTDEDLDDDYHVSLDGKDEKKLRRAMKNLSKKYANVEDSSRKPVIMEMLWGPPTPGHI